MILNIFAIDSENSPGMCAASSSGKYFKDSGVKKTIILAITPDIQENYSNVKKLWIALDLKNLQSQLEFCIATDLKLVNILLGIMAHGSTYPCGYCTSKKGCLHELGEPRTFESLRKCYWKYYDDGQKIEKGKQFFNVVHPCLINSSNQDILDVVPPCELHLLIGCTNTVYNSLQKLWPEVEEWPKQCYVVREAQHGGTFTGRSAHILLKKTSILKVLCPTRFSMYVRVFECLKLVVDSCFGQSLHFDFENHINDLKAALVDADIRITPKFHLLLYHVPEFCNKKQKGLGAWSEQCSESIHHEFISTWNRYILLDIGHPNYGQRLLSATCAFNCHHGTI